MSIQIQGIYDVNKYLFGTEPNIDYSKEFVNNILELAIKNLKANYIKEYGINHDYTIETDIVKISFNIVVKKNVKLKELQKFKNHLDCRLIL